MAAVLLTTAGAVAAQAPVSPPTAGDPFPAGDTHDTFLHVCSGCHAPAIAAKQRLSPAAWKALVEQMAGFGAQGTDAELAAITEYLARSFPDQPATK